HCLLALFYVLIIVLALVLPFAFSRKKAAISPEDQPRRLSSHSRDAHPPCHTVFTYSWFTPLSELLDINCLPIFDVVAGTTSSPWCSSRHALLSLRIRL